MLCVRTSDCISAHGLVCGSRHHVTERVEMGKYPLVCWLMLVVNLAKSAVVWEGSLNGGLGCPGVPLIELGRHTLNMSSTLLRVGPGTECKGGTHPSCAPGPWMQCGLLPAAIVASWKWTAT